MSNPPTSTTFQPSQNPDEDVEPWPCELHTTAIMIRETVNLLQLRPGATLPYPSEVIESYKLLLKGLNGDVLNTEKFAEDKRLGHNISDDNGGSTTDWVTNLVRPRVRDLDDEFRGWAFLVFEMKRFVSHLAMACGLSSEDEANWEDFCRLFDDLAQGWNERMRELLR